MPLTQDERTRAELLTIAQQLESMSANGEDDFSFLLDSARESILNAANFLLEKERDVDSELQDEEI